jgi:hypothetical protein
MPLQRGGRIVRALGGAAPAAPLPFVDRGARHPVGGIDGDRLRSDDRIGGGDGLIALLDRSSALRGQLPPDGSRGSSLD